MRPTEPADEGTMLGPFTLLQPLAAGGMGEVWDARHVRSGLRVAIKRVRLDVGDSPSTLRAFAREVRTAASLDHPSVVRVLDHGVEQTGPWLAMERARQTLEEAQVWADWAEQRRACLAVLDGLAAMHARGLCHRDIKPANILDVDGVWKIADFGIAHALTEDVGGRAGTPLYMAPEQVRGRSGALGAATDLYALGATVWHGVTGAPVFDSEDLQEVLRAHLQRPPGPFVPRTAVPSDLEDWLRTCLSKEPSDRFACAAEAAEVLVGLSSDWIAAEAGAPTSAASTTFALSAIFGEAQDAAPDRALSPAGRGERALPERWRRPLRPAASAEIRDAGLGLVHLRDLEPVGHEAARDQLWSALRAAATAPQVLSLEGPSGSGRATLARWLVHRSRELCALPTAVVTGLDPTDLLAEATLVLGGQLTAGGSAQALAARIEAIARGPALVVIYGDPPLDALRQMLLDAKVRCLALVVRSELTADDRAVRLGRLSDGELTQAVEGLLPLEDATLQRLLVAAAGNPGRARQTLDAWIGRGLLEAGPDGFRHTGGAEEAPPDAALQQLDPSARDLLMGAAVLSGRVPIEPWIQAARTLGCAPEALEGLEAHGWLVRDGDGGHFTVRDASTTVALRALAQTSGVVSTWRAAWCDALCERADALRRGGSDDVALQLLWRARRLARGREDAVEARVVLALGVHLKTSGHLEQAIHVLEEAIDRYRPLHQPDDLALAINQLGGAFTRSGRLEEAETQTLLALELPGINERSRAITLGNLGNVRDRQGRGTEAEGLYKQALALWERLGDPAGVSVVQVNLAARAQDAGRNEEALALYERARATFVGDEGRRVLLEADLASCLRVLGRPAEALAVYDALLDWCFDHRQSVSAAVLLLKLGNVYGDLERLDEARTAFERAAVAFRDRGAQQMESVAKLNLAEIFRRQGNLDRAAVFAGAALALSRTVGAGHLEALSVREEAWIALERGDLPRALRQATQAVDLLNTHGLGDDLEDAWWIQTKASAGLGGAAQVAARVSEVRGLATTRGVVLKRDWSGLEGTSDAE